MLAFILFLSVITYFFYHLYWKRKNLPPGPLPLPFFGNFYLTLKTPLGELLKQWKQEYGNLHTVWFGDTPIVMIRDAPTIFETIVKDGEAYTGRMRSGWDDVLRDGKNGIGVTDGEKWKENRRFALRVLREFGLGRNLMQERVLVEVTSLISNLRDDLVAGKEEISVQDALDMAVGSIINNLTLGYRLDKNNSHQFEQIKKLAAFIIHELGSIRYKLMESNPKAFKYLSVLGSYYNHYVNEIQPIKDFFYKQIENHRKTVNWDSEPRDFVEAFLQQQKKIQETSPESASNFDDSQLFGTILDLWIAGQETTSTTLAWVVIALIQNPEIQKKIQAELDAVIGSDRIITLDDKSNLNYLNAVIAEVQRYHLLGVVNVPRRSTKDTKINGYHFPSGTLFIYDNLQISHDEKYFADPKIFKPERFLDVNGKFFQPPELIPFGVGKRVCLGEGLARLELFLFTANIFNQFKLDYPSDRTDFGKFSVSATIVPLPFLCKVMPRH